MYLRELLERLHDIAQRVQAYPWAEVALELVILWGLVLLVVRFLRGTRGARVIMTVALVLIVLTPLIRLLASQNQFERLNFLWGQFVTVAAFTMVVVFQPELRRAFIRLGQAKLFRGSSTGKSRMIDELIASVSYLSRNKVGAIIAIERQDGLEGIVEAGTPIDAAVSRELLNTIFWPGSALHDMAVIIREDRVLAASVQLPLAGGGHFSSELGSRHRAAIGLTQESDALAVVVSEETGTISLAQRGQLVRNLGAESLRVQLHRALGEPPPTERRA